MKAQTERGRSGKENVEMLKRIYLTFVFAFVFVSAVSACPVCESETGRQVRAGIFNDGFGRKLVLTLLPFPIFIGVVAAIHFGFPFWMEKPRRSAASGAGVAAERSIVKETQL